VVAAVAAAAAAARAGETVAGRSKPPFEPVDASTLAAVVGGRMVSPSKEMDPALIAALQGLVKAVASINDSRREAGKASQQQIMQFMMSKMKDGGGGKK